MQLSQATAMTMATSRQHRWPQLLCTYAFLALLLVPGVSLAFSHGQHGRRPHSAHPHGHENDDRDYGNDRTFSETEWDSNRPPDEPIQDWQDRPPPDRPFDHHHHGKDIPFAPYLLPGELPDGRRKEFLREEWRIIGANLDTADFSDKLNEVSETIYLPYSYLGRLHQMTASVAAPTRLDGKSVSAADLAQDSFSHQFLSAYDSVDAQVLFSIDNKARYMDPSSVAATNYNRLKNTMNSAGQHVVGWLCWQLHLTFEARIILGHMPIPEYRSYLAKLKVTGANLVPFTLQKQNAVSATIADQLRFASVFSVRLLSVDQSSAAPGQNVSSAELSFVVQQDDSALLVEEALMSITTDPLGVPLFDVRMAQAGLPMSAVLTSVTDYWGDSITDQVIPAPDGPPPMSWAQMGALLLGVAVLAACTAVLSVCLRKQRVAAEVEVQMQQLNTPRLAGCGQPVPEARAAVAVAKAVPTDIESAGLCSSSAAVVGTQLHDEPLNPYSYSESEPLLLRQHQSKGSAAMYKGQHLFTAERHAAYAPEGQAIYRSERQAACGVERQAARRPERQAAHGAERPQQDLQASSYYPFREDSCSIQSGRLASRNSGSNSGSNSSSEHSLSLSQVEYCPDQRQLQFRQGQSSPRQGQSMSSQGQLQSSQSQSSPHQGQSTSPQGQLGMSTGQVQQPELSLQEWVIHPDQIRICEHPKGGLWQLGFGSFGVVYKAKRGTQDVAVKTIHSRLMSPHVPAAEAADNIDRELRMWKTLSHDRNLVQFYGSCEQDGKVLLVLEYMEGGDLRHALKALDGRAEQLKWHNKGAHIALDVIQGLQFLHSYGVMHRDIKSGNVLLSGDFSQAKICDVGLAHIMGSTSNGSRSIQATFAYSAPEMLLNYRCNEKADIFSYGVVLWEIITQETPQRGRMRDIQVPGECPKHIANLVESCLAESPDDRPAAQEIVTVIRHSLQGTD